MEEETLIIEQLSNYICLVITKQRPDLDKIRVAINEKFPSQNDLNREQRVIVPSIPVNGEIRVTFKSKKMFFYKTLFRHAFQSSVPKRDTSLRLSV